MAKSYGIISSKKELQTTLNKITADVMEEVSKKIVELLSKNIDKLWYAGGFNPQVNQRTYEVPESITFSNPVIKGRKITAKIWFDTKKIVRHSRSEFPFTNNGKGPFFNEHMSLDGTATYEGRTIGSWVVEWMEEGQDGPFPYEGAHFFRETEDKIGDSRTGQISSWTKNIIVAAYRRRGIKINID